MLKLSGRSTQLFFDCTILVSKKSRTYSNVVKLMPTAIGPLIQFMLNPLKKPFRMPSFLQMKNIGKWFGPN